MIFGQIKSTAKNEDSVVEKPPQSEEKSSSAEDFLKTADAKRFIEKWAKKTKDGKPMYTKRGIVSLLGHIFRIPSLTSNKKVLQTSDEILSMLGSMDGLQGFLMGWKAKSEGLIKGLKSAIGAK
jgi:hypothetical protein